MPPRNDSSTSRMAVCLLKGAALVFVVLGGAMVAWGIDKWVEVPGTRATQFGVEAPLWPAFVVFVLLATSAAVALLWTAARRMEADDLN